MKFREDADVIFDIIEVLDKNDVLKQVSDVVSSEKGVQPISLIRILNRKNILKKIVKVATVEEIEKPTIIDTVKAFTFYWKQTKNAIEFAK